MAREFRTTNSTEDTFAPTSPLAYTKMLFRLSILQNLTVSVYDVSDAFLQVPQRDFVIVQVPEWVREAVQDPTLLYWRLCKCLPGQRAAALEWNKHFAKLCEDYGFEAYQGGTLFRRKDGGQYLSVTSMTLCWWQQRVSIKGSRNTFEKILTLKSEGPFGMEKPGALYYLKRQISFGSEGIEVSVNPKYIPKLVSLLNLQDKRTRTIPTHSTLGVYSRNSVKEEEVLFKEEAKIFRSALGICLYTSQERSDVQFAVQRTPRRTR